jgi:hypothetical protein
MWLAQVGSLTHTRAFSRARRIRPAAIACTSERDRLHPGIEQRITGSPYVGLALLRIDNVLLGFFDNIENGRFAFSGAKNTDTEIHLFWPRVVFVLGDESENGVSRRGLESFKQRGSPAEGQVLAHCTNENAGMSAGVSDATNI